MGLPLTIRANEGAASFPYACAFMLLLIIALTVMVIAHDRRARFRGYD